MANSYNLTLTIGGKLASSLSSSANSAVKSISNIEKATKGVTSIMNAAIGGLAGYFSAKGVIDFGKSCVDASNQAATATQRLTTTMMNVPGTTPAMVQGIQAYSDALEKSTTIGHVANDVAASQLATFGMHSDAIKQLLPALDSMAVAQNGVDVTSGEAQQTATQLGRAVAGNTGMLTRYGIVLTTAQKAIFKNGTAAQRTAELVKILQGKYGNLATAMAQTPAGSIQQLQNAWQGVKETVGEQLTPVIQQVFAVIAKNLPQIKAGLLDTVTKVAPMIKIVGTDIVDIFSFMLAHGPAIVGIVAGIGGAFVAFKAVQGIISVVKGVQTVIGGVTKAVTFLRDAQVLQKVAQTAVNVATTVWSGICKVAAVVQGVWNAVCEACPIMLIVTGIALAITAGILLYKNWGKISAAGKQLWADIQPTFSAIGSFITGVFEGVWNGIKAYINLIIGGINGIVKGINAVSGVVGKVTGLKLTIPAIPQLAGGGIVMPQPGGTMVNVAEGGNPEAIVPLPKGGGMGGGANFTYAPQIVIQGDASKDDMKQVLSDDQREFERRAELWLKNKGRKSFAAVPA